MTFPFIMQIVGNRRSKFFSSGLGVRISWVVCFLGFLFCFLLCCNDLVTLISHLEYLGFRFLNCKIRDAANLKDDFGWGCGQSDAQCKTALTSGEGLKKSLSRWNVKERG